MGQEGSDKRLLVACPDQPGIVAAVSRLLAAHGANIVSLDQYSTNPEGGQFFMRVEFRLLDAQVPLARLRADFAAQVAPRFGMRWSISDAARRKRVAVLVSGHEHALLELLWLYSRDELGGDIVVVVSNHENLRAAVERFGLAYHHIPVTADTRAAAEGELLRVLAAAEVDLVVLARYMQVLSARVVQAWPGRIINIHHSFLPAFMGADPYRRAHERGVKLIGATAHYVTEQLDEGPIIEQDIARVTHKDSVRAMKQLGRGLERRVLARAVRWHLEDRIILNGTRTIVFH